MEEFVKIYPTQTDSINFIKNIIEKKINKDTYVTLLKPTPLLDDMFFYLKDPGFVSTIQDYLYEMYKKEKDSIEKLIYGILAGECLCFPDFRTKLFLNFEFENITNPSFSTVHTFSQKLENWKEETILNLLYIKYNKESPEEELIYINKKLEELVYFLPEEIAAKYIIAADIPLRFEYFSDIRLLAIIVSKLEDQEFYATVTEILFNYTPKDKILFLKYYNEHFSSCKPIDLFRISVNISIKYIELYVKSMNRRYYLDSLKVFQVIHLKQNEKLKCMFIWLQVFMFTKEINEFTSLMKSIADIAGNMKYFVIFDSFYKAILHCKTTNELNLDEFKKYCIQFQRDHEYLPYDWKVIYDVYGLN
ncbi:hypothetical protein TCON_2135 [Astathelohania contejeani]|uniref:Uncharacterized protein n=1 Tax=Astathelohania contejeani TaxID=164912 RepID=A0ABQ7HWY9_9MICR|nr:hypothetical protein TCON_2135 [Thelohania contejeani]